MDENRTQGELETGYSRVVWKMSVCLQQLPSTSSYFYIHLHLRFCCLCETHELWFCGIEWMEVLFDVMSAVERQSFCCVSIYCLSPVLPKLISPGPCPLTAGVACSVNKGLVLVRPLLYTQGWSDHSSLLSAIERQKPGQCLPLQTCGTAFTNFNWFKRW